MDDVALLEREVFEAQGIVLSLNVDLIISTD